MQRVPCRYCGAEILPATSERNEGACEPCSSRAKSIARQGVATTFNEAWNEWDCQGRLDSVVSLAAYRANAERLFQRMSSRNAEDRARSANTYVWSGPPDYPEESIGVYDRERSSDRFRLLRCAVLDLPNFAAVVRFEVSVSSLSTWPHLMTSAIVPLVSRAVQDLLGQHAAADCQLIPCQVEARDGTLDSYAFTNVTTEAAVADMRRSEYSLISGTENVMGFERLVCGPRGLGDHALARETNCASVLYVSATLATLLSPLGLDSLGIRQVATEYGYQLSNV